MSDLRAVILDRAPRPLLPLKIACLDLRQAGDVMNRRRRHVALMSTRLDRTNPRSEPCLTAVELLKPRPAVLEIRAGVSASALDIGVPEDVSNQHEIAAVFARSCAATV